MFQKVVAGAGSATKVEAINRCWSGMSGKLEATDWSTRSIRAPDRETAVRFPPKRNAIPPAEVKNPAVKLPNIGSDAACRVE